MFYTQNTKIFLIMVKHSPNMSLKQNDFPFSDQFYNQESNTQASRYMISDVSALNTSAVTQWDTPLLPLCLCIKHFSCYTMRYPSATIMSLH